MNAQPARNRLSSLQLFELYNWLKSADLLTLLTRRATAKAATDALAFYVVESHIESAMKQLGLSFAPRDEMADVKAAIVTLASCIEMMLADSGTPVPPPLLALLRGPWSIR